MVELPAAFAVRMRRLLGETAFEKFSEAYAAPMRRGVRANPLKMPATRLQEVFAVPLTPCVFWPEGFCTETPFKAGTDPLHHAGAYYVQEPSAMSAVAALSPRPGERVLDLCAAPGGKSTQIAGALRGKGLLWSHEYVRGRCAVLAQNLERCGVTNAVVSYGETAPVCRVLRGQFDAVLADVPCSGEGMFRKEPAALAAWSGETVAACAKRGREVLASAALAVAPGGRLVYATCTFAPEENECQLAWFLDTHPEFTLETLELPFGQPAFSFDRVASFAGDCPAPAADLTGARRIFPPEGEGHFVALLRRDRTPVAEPNGCPERLSKPRRVHGARPALSLSPEAAEREGRALYTACRTDTPVGRFVCTGETLRLLPPALARLPDTAGLPLMTAGVTVGQVRTGRVEPAHGLFLSAAPSQCRTCLTLSREDPRLTAFLRGEEIGVPETFSGYCAVAVEGVVTGFGKAVNGRLKNHYPKGLRQLT